MLQVPAPVAVTSPLLFTVATEVLSLLQAPAPPLRTTELAVNVVVAPIHKGLLIPVGGPTLALGLTVTVTVKDSPGQLGVPGAVGVTV